MNAPVPDGNVNSAETPEEFGKGGVGEVRRWAAEIKLAQSQFRKWHEQSKINWDRYRGRDRRKNSYNCLYANTSIIFPSVYNTAPIPDIRRRWDKQDEIGKAVSEVLSRSIEFNIETTNMDRQIRMDVLDMLICARGISRVRYVPSMVMVGDTNEVGSPEEEVDNSHEALQGEAFEELEWETSPIEHVQWDMYLHGPGKTWQDIPWFAFIHDLNRTELVEKFGEKGEAVPLTSGPPPEDAKKNQDDQTFDLFKTARIYEIWDKENKEIVWINLETFNGPLKREDDPYGFDNFFPCPEPLIAIVDSDITSPPSLFEQYSEQADELDRISARINRIVNAIKVRGLYDPSLGTQVPEIFRGEDNGLIAASESIRILQEAGGIEKFIWFAPIDKMAQVVQGLYAAREQCKAVIYEISGISDIMRGATDAQETLGAQNLKVAFGKGRVSDMQRNVQRYIRDLIQLQAQIIGKKFQTDTLQQMTQLDYPTNAEVALVMERYQMVAAQIQMAGQQPPPPPKIPPTWEQIESILKSDKLRSFRIDIETDSTIAATQQEDTEQLQIGMAAVTEAISKIWPMVQQGILPFDAAKAFVLTICRKFKFGNQLEDTLEQMAQPQAAPNPEEGKIQADMQKHQMTLQANAQIKTQEMQAEMQLEQQRAQLEQQTSAWEQEVQARENAHQQQLELQRDLQKQQFDMQLAEMREQAAADRLAMQSEMQLLIAQLNNARAVEIAEINAGTAIAQEQISAANTAAMRSGD